VGHSQLKKSRKKSSVDGSNRRDANRRVRQAEKFARILRLLELLQSRTRHNAESLARGLVVTRRTVQRDLDLLELAGINYSYDAQSFYVLEGNYRFAITGLTDDELLGQATATAMTLAKGLDIGSGAEQTTRKLRATGRSGSQMLLEDALRSSLSHWLSCRTTVQYPCHLGTLPSPPELQLDIALLEESEVHGAGVLDENRIESGCERLAQ
jgi:hypothetical protein